MTEAELNLVAAGIADDADCAEQLLWNDYFLRVGVPSEYVETLLSQRSVILAALPSSPLADRTAH